MYTNKSEQGIHTLELNDTVNEKKKQTEIEIGAKYPKIVLKCGTWFNVLTYVAPLIIIIYSLVENTFVL